MNKFKFIVCVFIFIIVFCVVGVFFVQADDEIVGEEDILVLQNEITDNISAYGYTFDNPKVIVNPYNENYNSALIIFETDKYVSIKVNVNDMYSYNSGETNKHYIGVYNLVEGINNISLSYGNKEKNIEIDIGLENEKTIDFSNTFLLSNNHLLTSTGRYNDDNSYTGIREIDALGKIYYEYLLEDGYMGISCEIDEERLAVLSKNLIILDRQNGNVIMEFDISKYKNSWIYIDYLDYSIILYGNDISVSVDMDGNISEVDNEYEKKYFSGDINYNNKSGIRFYKEIITNTSNENIWLLNYEKKFDKDISIKKEFNRIVVSGNDISNCDIYLILDKLFDKRVYNLCHIDNYIYTYDMSGKYSVYLKKDKKVYKIGKYLEF